MDSDGVQNQACLPVLEGDRLIIIERGVAMESKTNDRLKYRAKAI